MAAASTEIARQLGATLRWERKRTGLSQEELGFRGGLHRTAVGRVERGERAPHADSVIRLAGALRIPPGNLLADIEWEPIAYTTGGYRLAPSDESGGPQDEERGRGV